MRKVLNKILNFDQFHKKKITKVTIYACLELVLYIKLMEKTLKNVYVFPGLDNYITLNVVLDNNEVILYQIFEDHCDLEYKDIYIETCDINFCKWFYFCASSNSDARDSSF